ncbi:MAG: ABC transporter permease [Chloroflexi bacterium]|nr:ABC transporter permease [Chloroflexota bacterium]
MPLRRALSFTQRYPTLTAGLIIVLVILLFGPIGALFVDTRGAKVGSAPPDRPPSAEYPLGTDTHGRQLLPVILLGTPKTMRVGLMAGAIGLGVGIVLGFVAGYTGGIVDNIIKGAADILLTVPGLLLLVVIATTIRGTVSVNMMAFVVSALAWMWPTRTIRAQVLTLREREFVRMAKLGGMKGAEIIVFELMPNLLPYLASSFVGAVASAILASIGLEALGLGPQNEPTLGMTIYWALYYTSVLRGLWWWWAPPIAVIVLTFMGLFLVSAGLDQIANPRLRRAM